MDLGFSEFSFGYAFTENLTVRSQSAPGHAPVFLNVHQEAAKGFDVEIGLPISLRYLQFKLPKRMQTARAREIEKFGCPISAPFFRMRLMSKNMYRQHHNLIALEDKNLGRVFYATPLLRDEQKFNEAYANKEVHLKTALFSPKDIGQISDFQQHTIAYSESSDDAWLCSTPKKIKYSLFENMVGKLDAERESDAQSKTESPPSLEKIIPTLTETTLALVPDDVRRLEGVIRKNISDRAADRTIAPKERSPQLTDFFTSLELLRLGLGCDTFFAQRRDS